MRSLILSVTLFTLFLVTACRKNHVANGVPACINALIDKEENAMCQDAHTDEYLFQGNFVYVFEPGTCGNDMCSPVYDAGCHPLGHLGGISGNTMINQADFRSSAVFKRIIWHK